MAVVSGGLIILLVSFSSVGSASGSFGMQKPWPENQYPLEHASAEVTCVAFDHTGVKIPEKILFVREKSGTVTYLTANDNIYFTNRTEDNGRKLFVTFHIRNATMQDDTSLGRYLCHAFAIGDPTPRKFGFSVTVIKRKEIPKVVATLVDSQQHGDEAKFYCNITDRGSLESSLEKMSWLIDSKEVQSKQNPSIAELNPLVIKNVSLRDGGNYTCVLETRLRRVRKYSVRDTIVVSSSFGMQQPYPENQYPLEHTSTKVTCVAFDHTGVKIPEKILFVREKSGTVTYLTANDNIYFTNRTEDNGRKLFVTFHIRNATMQDDTSLGRYLCHAFAIGDPTPRKFGFSVTVIKRKEIPKVVATTVDPLQHGYEARFYCNITDRGSQESSLDKMSWLKDGKEVQSTQNASIAELNPLVIKNVSLRDGGNYTCVLETRLRGVRKYSVRDTTVVSIAPWFEDEEENSINVRMIRRNITLKCGARGFPLNVEWKVKKENDGMVDACIDSSRDKRYKISRNGIYEPYFLSITNLTTDDTGDYYCCLPSNCSANIDGRCQRFQLTVIDPSTGAAMVVVSRTVLLAMVLPLALFLSI